MIFRLAISFSLAGSAALAGTVTGQVELTGPLKPRNQMGVVVWLEPVGAAAPPVTQTPQMIVHKDKTFLPHVLPVIVGNKVSFPNKDPWFHNAFSNYDGQMFDIGMHPPGTAREVVFRRPGVVRVFCNIHPTMSAVIVVLATPYFAATNAAGQYSIPAIPAGEYRLKVFHERVLPPALDALERTVSIGEADLALPKLSLTTAGFIAKPQKNKYGKDYPAVIKDQYPGQNP